MSLQFESGRPKVLVVDDDPSMVDLITTRLELAGHHTVVARNGFEALHRITEFRPIAMVLDLNMPGMDGFGVLKRLGQLGLSAKIPTMVLTARHQTDDVRKAVALGARDFLAKPFDDTQLLARIARLLRGRRSLPAD